MSRPCALMCGRASCRRFGWRESGPFASAAKIWRRCWNVWRLAELENPSRRRDPETKGRVPNQTYAKSCRLAERLGLGNHDNLARGLPESVEPPYVFTGLTIQTEYGAGIGIHTSQLFAIRRDHKTHDGVRQQTPPQKLAGVGRHRPDLPDHPEAYVLIVFRDPDMNLAGGAPDLMDRHAPML